MKFDIGSTVIYFLVFYAIKVVCDYVCFNFSVASTWKCLGVFLKVVTWLTLLVLYLVLYLCVLVLSAMISLFGVFSTYGITCVCASGVSAFIFPIFIFGIFPFSWCNSWIFAWLIILIGIFARCTCWSSSGYDSTIGTLRSRSLLNGFYWNEFFIWVISLFTCWRFSCYAPLTGTLRGTAGGVAFLNISDRYPNASLCEFLSMTSGIDSAGFCIA